jgi:hypothetical protein
MSIRKEGCCKVCGEPIDQSDFEFQFCSIACHERAIEIARQCDEVMRASAREEKLAARVERSSGRIRRARKKLSTIGAQWAEAIDNGDLDLANEIRADGLTRLGVLSNFEGNLKVLLRRAASLRQEALKQERRLDQLRNSN